ncbi:PstS family phosphate ABC transporter substrate-binding protein [Pedobacter immunditicola]|uniref:PstS family phosphate ABC transporter substrate-binding protein n=1 Tax=Pedobacter immunditicola TaxID=3133440 RepID=UPI0030A223CD
MKQLTGILLLFIALSSCQNSEEKGTEVSRTVGNATFLVDESFGNILDDQIEVFNSDYPEANLKVITGNENKILPTFLNDSTRVIVMSRVLSPEEEKTYSRRSIPVYTSRFAIDGIALITSNDNPDSTVTVAEVIAILKGTSTSGKSLVFDNAYSSTLRYFKELAKINTLPKKGVYTLNNNNDVIKYVDQNKDYIGVVGVNWLLQNTVDRGAYTQQVKMMGVKNLPGKKGDNAFYKPTQDNLISGIYPFLRNIYIINGEGKNGLGTGFANWLLSQRGQLIVLKSGLGPHKLTSRDFNLKN